MIINDIVAESMDTHVVFELDSDSAIEAVMDRLSHRVEWQGNQLSVSRQLWPTVQRLAVAAGGQANEIHELTELDFMGSPCTKDCSGHQAGYAWSKARGGTHAASWSNSFNNGAALAIK